MACRLLLMNFGLLLLLHGCDSSSGNSPSQAPYSMPDPPLADALPSSVRGGAAEPSQRVGTRGMQPYHLHSPYAAVLASCALVTHEDDACSLSILPFMATDEAPPGMAQVMDRVLVSHQWMGDRFAQLLAQMPDDIFSLFKPVTAIVIAEDVRPSYYWAGTGAMYLDPLLLWQTQEEKLLLAANFDQDVGLLLDNPLAFHTWGRYVAGDRSVYNATPLDPTAQRTLSDLVPPFAALLFHELAHANDFFPPQYLSQIPRDITIAEAAYQQWGRRPSDRLWMEAPPLSATLFRFADILYAGQSEPTEEEKSVSGAEIAAHFDADRTNDDYAYISQYEDLAMLFEEVMMHYHFGLKRDVAYLSKPDQVEGAHCDEYKVEWGSRHRIARVDIKRRAQSVVEALLPDGHWTDYFDSLGAPQMLPEGSGWCESTILVPSGRSSGDAEP